MNYKIGDHVGFVELVRRDPVERPQPKAWHLLQVYPHREFKVMKALRQRNVSAYLPIEVRSRNRKSGATARRPHLGHVTRSPIFLGLILLPDFEIENRLLNDVEGIEGLLYIGPCLAMLRPHEVEHVRIIESVFNTPRSERKYMLGDVVRLKDGPFAGFVGRIDRLDSGDRLRILIAAVKRGVSVVTSETQIELEDPATHDLMVRRQGLRALERNPSF